LVKKVVIKLYIGDIDMDR